MSGSAAQPIPSQRRKSAFSPSEVIDLTDEPPVPPGTCSYSRCACTRLISPISASSRADRKASVSATSPSREVIEILDSDEEPPPPPPPVSETANKASKPEPKRNSGKAVIPRRNKEHLKTEPPKPVSHPSEIIVLDSSDDDEPPPGISVPQGNEASARRKGPFPEQRKAPLPVPSSPFMECKPSPPASPPLWSQAQPLDDRMPLSPPLPPKHPVSPVANPPPLEDVEMVQEPLVAIDAREASALVDFEMGVEEMALRSSPGAMPEPELTIAPVMESPVDVPDSLDKERDSEHASTSQPEAGHLAGTSLSAETVLRDGSSTHGNASPHQVKMDSLSQSSQLADSAQPPPTLFTASSSTVVASLRAETASPVTRVLDPELQGLAITESIPESPDPTKVVSGFSSPSNTIVSTRSK